MLSSFEAYNVGFCGYQQQPWMANISGIGVWSGSGNLQRLSMFDVSNLYSPYVSQQGKVLIAAYCTLVTSLDIFYYLYKLIIIIYRPPSLLSMTARSMFNRESYVHWPSPLFDEEIRQCLNEEGVSWAVISRREDNLVPTLQRESSASSAISEDPYADSAVAVESHRDGDSIDVEFLEVERRSRFSS